MRIFPFLIVFFFLVSCKSSENEKLIDRVSEIELSGINNYKRIDYGVRGNTEIFEYHVSSDSSLIWTFNLETGQFDFNKNKDTLENLISNFEEYHVILRQEIHKLNLMMIVQSPWIGKLTKFWISQDEILIYVDSDFKFVDNKKMKPWLSEINSGLQLNENWYYVKVNK